MPKKSEETTALAKPESGGAMAAYDYGAAARLGFDRADASHYLVPRIDVLQPMSPEVTEGSAAFVPAARPGMFFNKATRECVDGKTGLVFVPVEPQHAYLDFVPREKGGGFRGQHAPGSSVVLDAVKKAGRAFGRIGYTAKTPEGNEEPRELVETFTLLGMILASPDAERASEFVALNFKSTQIKKYKALMYRLSALVIDGKPVAAPLFAHRLRLTTLPERNAKGNWFGIEIRPAVGDSTKDSLLPPNSPVFDEGWKWSERVRTGGVTVQQEDQGPPDEEDGGEHF